MKESSNRKNSNIDPTFEKIKKSMIEERNLDEEISNKNIDKILAARFFTAVFAGMVAGILDFTGFIGLGFYFANFLVVSVFLFLHIKKQKGNFSTSLLSLLFTGLFRHGMTYTIFWVMFYNLVHIYN